MSTVAVTGASGFVGGHVLAKLCEGGYRVRALLRHPTQIDLTANLTPVVGRLDHPDALDELLRGADHLVHLAGATGGVDYADFARVNVAGTRHLLDACARAQRPIRFLHLSSLAARAPALSDYAASKRAGEKCVAASTLDWVILRPPAVYGPDDPALAPLWQALARGWLIQTGPPDARFSLIHVHDLAAAILALVQAPAAASGQIIEIDDGQGGYGWDDLKRIAEAQRKKRVRIVAVPPTALKVLGAANLTMARLARRRPPPLVPGKVRELVHHDWVCDNTGLPGCPDWRPNLTLESALSQLPGWSKTG
jgi:nucleoside-diphosphate-sugar epimerase